MLETGLESLSYNLNRRNNDLCFFEFGKTYHSATVGDYRENNHLSLYLTGRIREDSWKGKGVDSDLYFLKGIALKLADLLNLQDSLFGESFQEKLDNGLRLAVRGKEIMYGGMVKGRVLKQFDIRQPVYFADFNWDLLVEEATTSSVEFRELPRQLPVFRDLALVVNKNLAYEEVEKTVQKIRLDKLQQVRLFDIFESQKLGPGKKSMAISFTFLDEEKTLTDKEIDGMMNRIMKTFEQELEAEIRR